MHVWLKAALGALVLAVALGLTTVLLFVRAIRATHARQPRSTPAPAARTLAVFLGSGGHTAETMRLLEALEWSRYPRRTYLISSGDSLSERKALELERSISEGRFEIVWIPRARRVKQSYASSVFTTAYALAFCLWRLSLKPLLHPAQGQYGSRRFADVFLANGPGTCVPIGLALFLPRLVGLPSAKQIYVESWARTRRLSMSARIVRIWVDEFYVQWESLKVALNKSGRSSWKAEVKHRGWLV